MSTLVIDRCGIPVLGQYQDENRAEELIEWSKKQPSGKRWVRDFPFGLRLGFVSAGEEPKMYIHWNHQRFLRFLDLVGQHDRFFIVSYGICVEYSQGQTRVSLLGAGKTGKILWDTASNAFSKLHASRDASDEVHWLTGIVRFSSEGPLFLEQMECQTELEEATAVAVIEMGDTPPQARKVRSLTEVLPPSIPLSISSRNFLLRDVAASLLLQKTAKNKSV